MRRSLVLVCPLAGHPGVAFPQWSARIEEGAIAFRGASHDKSGLVPSADFRPYHAATAYVGIERRWGRFGTALGLLHASPGVAAESDKTVFVAKDLLAFWEIAPEASVRLVQVGGGIALRAQVGPVLDIRLPNGETSHSRVGAHTGVTLEWPLGAMVTGSLRAALAFSGSAFEPEDLPSRFELRPLVRRSIAGGVRWRF
jgi:hypothetical protein